MSLGDGGGGADAAGGGPLCPVCESGALAPWPSGGGVTCTAGCGVAAPVALDGGGGGGGGVAAAARARLAAVHASHGEGGCGARLRGVACGGGGVVLGCGACGVWERVL